VGRFVLDSVDTITTHAAEAYLREDNRIRTQTGRAVRDLIESLIAGRALPDRARHPAAPALDPARPMQVIVARATRTEHDLNTALGIARDTLVEHLALGTAPPLRTIRQQEVVVIAPGAPPVSRLHEAARGMRERHLVELSVGVSDAPLGFAAVSRAYGEAALALSYATIRRPVVALTELRALQLVLLASADSVRGLIAEQARALNDLTAAERATTIETITAFAATDMSISQTARTLDLHPNTVRYRLARIAKLTGLDPRTFAGLADLHCIVELRQAAA
jgi:sugar diacid utilization regulator